MIRILSRTTTGSSSGKTTTIVVVELVVVETPTIKRITDKFELTLYDIGSTEDELYEAIDKALEGIGINFMPDFAE